MPLNQTKLNCGNTTCMAAIQLAWGKLQVLGGHHAAFPGLRLPSWLKSVGELLVSVAQLRSRGSSSKIVSRHGIAL